VCVLAAALLLVPGGDSAGAESYAARPEVRQFIAEMARKHGFSRTELESVFSQARVQPSIIRAMQTPAESPRRSWQSYRSNFLTPQRIEAGVRFKAANAEALSRASALYGVPEDIVVAIIGVETVYGRNVGGYRVLDALATLAFDFPARADYFRSELEQFLLHSREAGLEPLATRGSYAGAIGIPQFMPGTYRRYAVDFDGDGRRDLRASNADAIGSVANFLKEHGWAAGQPVAARARVSGADFVPLLEGGIKPGYRVEDLAAVGVTLAPGAAAAPDALCSLIELQTPGQSSEYWLGFDNFFALTRYNRSSVYAIAVLELATAIGRSSSPRE
jgi:membrane-bound lytic murein transglycosylase B